MMLFIFLTLNLLRTKTEQRQSSRSTVGSWVPHTHLQGWLERKMFVQSSQNIVKKTLLPPFLSLPFSALFRCSRFTANLFIVKQSKCASAFWNPETWWKSSSLQIGMMMVARESQVSWTCQLLSGCEGKHQWAALAVSSPCSFPSFGY